MDVSKATSEALQELLRCAWENENVLANPEKQKELAQYVTDQGFGSLLPQAAVDLLTPAIPVSKALIKEEGVLMKAWDSGDTVLAEGWLSTPRLDREKDITEPESFIGAMPGYFARRAPLSIQHGLTYIPIGHLQKAVVVRDGQILATGDHPTDPAEFEHFPAYGSGVWVRAVANQEPGMSALRKGNVGGFSFTATGTQLEKVPGGRYRYRQLTDWIESTVAPYPINPDAVIAVVK